MKHLSILFFISLMLYSCQQKEEAITPPSSIILAGAIENAGEKEISITNREGAERINEKIVDGEFHVEVPLTTVGYVDFFVNRNRATLFAEPGDSIYIVADAAVLDSSLVYAGDHAVVNNFLADKGRYNAAHEMNPRQIYNQDYDSFVNELNTKRDDLAAFYSERGNAVDADFIALDKKMEALSSLVIQTNYKSYYEYMNEDKEAEVPDDYDQLITQLDLTDADIVKSSDFNSLMDNLLSNQEPKIDYYTTGSEGYFKGLYDRASQLEQPVIREAAVYDALRGFISYGGGLDNITTEVDDYRAINPTETHMAAIDKLVDKWAPLKRGNEAPSFVGSHMDGKDFELADLRGQNVYVDVWATWCGPCKREIPHLKEVEKDYHDKNIAFLSISIDEQKDKEKWQKFVEEEKLGGIQVHAPEAWKSDVVENYKINGIPRFLLIDAEGKIVSANAPRPSMDKLREVLDDVLAKG